MTRQTGEQLEIINWNILDVIAVTGGYKLSEVTAGSTKKRPNGLGVSWMQWPLFAVNKIAEVSRIQVG